MLACTWVITFAFPFPAKCSREDLRGLLHSHAKEWMGWERFPWRITRDMHHFIDDPPINFHYLLIQHCVTAYACHVVLSAKFMNLDDVLDMLIRNRFEFVGVLRHELIRSLLSLRDMEGKAHIPDCSNAEEGDRRAGAKEILRRRRAVMHAFEKATEETVRILNYASQEPNMLKHIAGHSLEAWARGDSMPSPAELMVAIDQVNGETVISPQPKEVSQFARVNRPVPKLVVSGLRAQSQARMVLETSPVIREQLSPQQSAALVAGQAVGGSKENPVASDESAVNPAAEGMAVSEKKSDGPGARDKAGTRALELPERFRPLSDDWRTVQWEGTPINLRDREKAKDFLRMLWNKGAKRRTLAVAAGARFAKPSSLFVAGERYVRELASGTGRDVAVPSESGAMIRMVYRDAVGKVVAGKRGVGPTKYYLRVFADSDNT